MDSSDSARLVGAWRGYQLCRTCGDAKRHMAVELRAAGEGVKGTGRVEGARTPDVTLTGRLDAAGKVTLAVRFGGCVDPHDGFLEGRMIYGSWTCPETRCQGGFALWRDEARDAAAASAAEAAAGARKKKKKREARA